MPINFIPNDPRAGAAAPQMRTQVQRPDRPANRSGFIFSNTAPVGVFPPGTPDFLFWQCREAALAAVEAFESSAGSHAKWQGNRSKLRLLQNQGQDLNAFYDRDSFSFFKQTEGNATFFSGASTDVVAHELGHGLLDAIRPDFFDVNFLEVGAAHEAFGDCMAILTALADGETRTKLLAVTSDLTKKNFVEGTAEDLAEGIHRMNPTHNAAATRRALNKFKFQIPETLPFDGPPGALINEVHSFGMLFSGCFWDLIVNMFRAETTRNANTLETVARNAGAILIAGMRGAVVTPRFLQSAGRAMVLADQNLTGGVNRDHIRNAFAGHDILLGANAMIAPAMMLEGAAPKGKVLSAVTAKSVIERLGGTPGARLRVAPTDMFGTRMLNAVHTREVPLGTVDRSLRGVVAVAHEPVLVGGSGGRAAIMGAVPNAVDTQREVQAFVQSLLEHDQIKFGKPAAKKAAVAKKTAAKRMGLVAPVGEGPDTPTHVIRQEGDKKVLQRIRFRCH